MAANDDGSARSVFRTPDQQEMIARLDAVEDDDVETDFFSTSAQEAEDAAVRMFDLGIRTLGSEQEAGSASSFPSRVSADSPAAADLLVEDDQQAPVQQVFGERSFDDANTRRDFILGGPAALGSVD